MTTATGSTHSSTSSGVSTPARQAPLQGRGVAQDFLDVARLAAPQARQVAWFILINLGASLILMLGLVFFNAGFSTSGGAGSGPSDPVGARILGLFALMGIPPDSHWLVFFSGFLLLSVAAAAMEHWSWTYRIKMLATYEANQMAKALRLICDTDPRVRMEMSRREMLLGVRRDSKSIRKVFNLQLIFGISIARIVFPLWFMFTLDAGMSTFGLAILSTGFVPVVWMARRAARISLTREDAKIEVGSRFSELFGDIQAGHLDGAERDSTIGELSGAVGEQHLLWRQQLSIRSLSEKVPMAFSLIGTYVLLVWGVAQIRADELTWGKLFTFVIAARVVFNPLTAVGKLVARSGEYMPHAVRHLDFMRRLREGASSRVAEPQIKLEPPLESIHAVDLVLMNPDGSRSEPLSLELQPGSILCIVDESITLDNPLYVCLRGQCYVAEGRVTYNGLDVNTLHRESIARLFDRFAKARNRYGTVLEWCQRVDPSETRQSLERHGRAILGDAGFESIDRGLDSEVSTNLRPERIEGRPMEPSWIRVSWFLHTFALAKRNRVALEVDYCLRSDVVGREVMLRYLDAYRKNHITLWLDTAPRSQLGELTIAAFDKGQLLGMGDWSWFKRSFPNWDYCLPAGLSVIKQRQAVDLGVVEAIEDDDEM